MVTCPSCGQESPQQFRFCGNCGAALTAPAAGEVRKVVTVLFADVTGSTALGERLDPEAFRRLMSRYLEEMRAVLESHGGTVEKFIGDAVMAVFGVPRLSEDDARRALDAAASMRERLSALNVEFERDFGLSLEARIGVNTGWVVTGLSADGERFTSGDAVNVAARLQQAATPGEILLGERTLGLARAALEVEPVAPLTLKGKRDPVAAYSLVRVLEGAPAFERRLDAPLVGRRDELARVLSAFDEAVSERRCALVTILGPPGIGKSRLTRAVAARLGDDAQVFSGRCLPHGEGSTYAALREAFADGELDEALGAGAPEDVFWAVRKAIEARARERRLLLALEDLHFAEPTLLDLVQHLADWTRDAQLLLLCNARPELIDERPAWGGLTLTLEPLAEPETEELIASLLGDSELEAETRARVLQVSEGNPLFVEQMVAALVDGVADGVPPTIQALLSARLDALPDDERAVLERAAVIGPEFEWEALGTVAHDGRRPAGALLAALVRKELIRPHESSADAFRFRHQLIRDAAYERIPKELRSELHERLASSLEAAGDEVIGYHLEQAHRLLVEVGSPSDRSQALAERAGVRLAAAGRRAYARTDTPAAANLLGRAAVLLPARDSRRLSILPSLGRALTEAGDLERADSVLSEAIDAAEAAGERGVAADALIALVFVRSHTAQMEVAEASRLLEGALAELEELGDEPRLARAYGLAGTLRWWRGETVAAAVELERAAEHARRAGDRAQEAYSLQFMLAALICGPMPVEEAIARVEPLRSASSSNRRLEVNVLRTLAQLEAMRARFDLARAHIERARMLAQESGLEMVLTGGVAYQAGFVELLAGDLEAAERTLRSACEALERIGNRGQLATTSPLLAEVLLLQGRDDEALLWVERAGSSATTGLADEEVAWRRVRAKLEARRGELAEGERLAREAVEWAARTDRLIDRAAVHADLAEVLRLAGRDEEAAAALDEAIRLHEQKGNLAARARLLRAPTPNL
jgi:class 3 adenylate cyclase/tetratricopeptide (TPR) repeat protein